MVLMGGVRGLVWGGVGWKMENNKVDMISTRRLVS